MKLTVALLSTLIATSAFAGSINLDTRIDSDSTSYNTDAGKPGNTSFTLQTGRVDFKGNASADLSYRIRLRFNKTPAAVSALDSLNDSTDFAQITHKMGDFALIVGKMDVVGNGFEGATSGADLYSQSVAYKTVAAVGRYQTGVALSYLMGDHTFALAKVNNPAATTAGANADNSRTGTGLIYKGMFLDKALTVLGTYHTFSDGNGTDNWSKNLMTVGALYKMDAMTYSFDYNTYTLGTSGTLTDKLTSMVFNAGYAMSDMNTIRAKIESSSKTVDAVTDVKTDTTAIGLAFECKPIKDADFRYHAAYTTSSAKADSAGAVTVTENHFIVGTRLMADFLT